MYLLSAPCFLLSAFFYFLSFPFSLLSTRCLPQLFISSLLSSLCFLLLFLSCSPAICVRLLFFCSLVSEIFLNFSALSFYFIYYFSPLCFQLPMRSLLSTHFSLLLSIIFLPSVLCYVLSSRISVLSALCSIMSLLSVLD